MACPDPVLLEKLLNGELLGDEQQETHAHVERCISCKTRVEELEGHKKLLSDILDKFPTGMSSLRSEPEPMPDQIGPYPVVSEIGRGGMGAILEVRDPKLRRKMALKLIHGDETGVGLGDVSNLDVRSHQRFQEEAQITSQLNHPGIVPVHELGRLGDGRLYFTMQLVQGRNLRQIFDLVERGEEGWTRTRALGAILRVCEAMAYAHSKGVIHRDLKPANVMVGEFGEVYVMDWGVARVMGQDDRHDLRLREQTLAISSSRTDTRDLSPDSPLVTMDGDVIGTPVYMSPEQAQGLIEELSTRSDVYSVGAMLYHMLTGTVPYVRPGTRPSSHVVLARVIDGPPTPVAELAPSVPAELVSICEKAMEREPDDRYADMLEMAEDLRAYLEQRVVRAYETGAVAEFKKWVQRNRGLAGAIAAALIAVLGGLLASVLIQINAQHVQRLKSDIYLLRYLIYTEDSLVPAQPHRIPDLEAWIANAEDLVSRRALHEGKLAGLDENDFDWRHERQFLDDLAEFEEPGGMFEDVKERLTFASGVRERSLDGVEARALWAGAVASIANQTECPMYGGYRLAPQLGLLPIDRDPDSGLWEFAHLRTGDVPRRDPVTGELEITEATGLVFVLIPGGSFRMGSTRDSADEGYVEYLASARKKNGDEDEFEAHTVRLAPYFISKYEMTQAQWERAAGTNPSKYKPGGFTNGEDRPITGLHPVEQVSWSDCDEMMRRLGLLLPTEAQWERAARGGKPWAWSTGPDMGSLVGHANFADSGLFEKANWPAIGAWRDNAPEDLIEYSDGYRVHAPVTAFRPNPFGLHNVHGNVWEWCRDYYGGYDYPVQPGTGERVTDKRVDRAYRGGSFKHEYYRCRSADRAYDPPTFTDNYMGIRPARQITE